MYIANVRLRDSEALYKALRARDSRFDGLFFVGVKSTGIYCRPVCTGQAAEGNQLPFYNTAQEAEQAGYPSVPAMPAGIGSRQCAGGQFAAHRPSDRAAH